MDVGFVGEVDLTGSSVNGPRFVHALRLQVLNILKPTQEGDAYYYRDAGGGVRRRLVIYLTLVQNSSYRAQAIRQRSNRMRTLWSPCRAAASSDAPRRCVATSDSSVDAWFGSGRRQQD